MQAQRVKNFMNYQIMDQMKEYESDFDQMLFYLPLSGSTFKKVYYDDLLGRAVSKFVPADDLVVPYTATSLDDAEAIIHKVKISESGISSYDAIEKLMQAGFDGFLMGEHFMLQDKTKQREYNILGLVAKKKCS